MYISLKKERITLSKSRKIIEGSFKKYLRKMERLKKKGYCDEAAIDVERMELVLSYFTIAMDLIDNGATFNI